MKLYELPAAFNEIEALLIDGEMTEEAMDRLARLEGALADKVQACMCVAQNFAARSAARKRESDRLASLAYQDANNEKRLREYVQRVMEQLGQKRVDTDLFAVWIQANAPAVTIDETVDVQKLPDGWIRIKFEPNKTAIMQAHKDGAPLPEGISITQTRSLRSK